MHCTYGPQLPVKAEQIDAVLEELRAQGVIEQLLRQE
jgi:hypothetical protein